MIKASLRKANSRARAAAILSDLVAGSGSLSGKLREHKDLADYPLLQETCYGCCRWFHLLDAILSQLLSKPIKAKDSELRCLLIVGLYQLRELSVPDYAVINESVSAVVALKKPWAKSLVNAVLRNYLRKQEEIADSLAKEKDAVRYSFPEWLYAEICNQWPQQARSIFHNSNSRPPMTLRVNRLEKTRDEVLASIAQVEFMPAASAGSYAPSAVYLQQPRAVQEIPGFDEGWLSIQDEASQLVPKLLQLEPNLRVLDACAAPGGKTCHILESEQSLTELVVLDLAPARLERITENLERLHLRASLQAADAADTDQWWDGTQFDRILLDAPCSATGVIRRHPDIKLLRSPQEVDQLVQTQARLLNALWACLKPGGLLLYTTCSILQQENQQFIANFLNTADNAKYERITADWGVECNNGRQLLPGDSSGPDGFFYSLLRKH